MSDAPVWLPFRRSLVSDARGLEDLCDRIRSAPWIGFDTEGSGPNQVSKPGGKDSMLDVHRSNLTGASFAFPDWTSVYVPVDHKRGDENLPAALVPRLWDALRESRCVVAVHNLDHEIHQLSRPPVPAEGLVRAILEEKRSGSPADQRWQCTLVQSWNLGLNPVGGYGLKKLAPRLLGLEMSKFETVAQGRDFDQLRPREGLDYACEDAEAALALWLRNQALWDRWPGLEDWYLAREMPFCGMLNRFEHHGMLLDHARHEQTVAYLRKKDRASRRAWVHFCLEQGLLLEVPEGKKKPAGDGQKRWEKRCADLGVPVVLNPGSSTQLQALYERGIWPTEVGSWRASKGKSGAWSTDGDHKEAYAEHCPAGSPGRTAAELLLGISGSTKLLSAYGPKLPKIALSHADGRFRDSIKQAGTKTGRASSSVLLLVPKHSEDGKKIRESFVSTPGWSFVAGDYSQGELRVLAHFARHGALFDTFTHGVGDPHRATGDALGITRDEGKTVNFAIVYGAGPKKVAAAASVPVAAAEDWLRRVNSDMEDEVSALDRAEETGRERGYVRTLGGRFREVFIRRAEALKYRLHKQGKRWDDEDDTFRKACFAVGREKRIARNTPIQGGLADIVKKACVDVWRALDPERARPLLQIHDDILFEARDDYAHEAAAIMRETMENAWPLRVPLAVDVRVGKRWSDL